MKDIKIIGEIANTHDGDFNYLLKMLELAHRAKLDYVKVQMFTANGLVTKDHPKYKDYVQKEFTIEEWLQVSDFCNKKKLKLIAEIFDIDSLKISEKMNICAYKIHSTNLLDYELIDIIAKSEKTIFLSAGGTTIDEIENAINIIRKNGSNKIVLLNGFQNFPTDISDTNLNRIFLLKQRFKLDIGLQDHINGEEYLSKIVPFMALSMGYKYIEKHYTLDRSAKGVDYYSSLNPDELINLTKELKRSTKLFGDSNFSFSDAENNYRQAMKKKVVASRNLKKGQTITQNDISYKRSTNEGILTDQIKLILNKKINKDILQDDTIKLKDLI